jgi:dihydrolipoamide dehydrogenase
VRPLEKRLKARYQQIMLGTKVIAGAAGDRRGFAAGESASTQSLTRLVAVGRAPNGGAPGAEAVGPVDGRGYITVDKQQRSNVPHIFAIGDGRATDGTRPRTRAKSPRKWRPARRVTLTRA